MKIKLFIIITMIVISSTLVLAEPIKIGAIIPLADATGKQNVNAMNLAIKQVNSSGGLLGRQVELIVMDDEMKPEKAVSAIDKLVTVDKVDVIIGGFGSATTMAMIPSMKKYQKIVIWSGAVSSKVEEAMQGQDFFFHTLNWDYDLAILWDKSWKYISKMYKIKRQKIFIMYEEGVFGTGSFKAQKELNDKLGRETIGVPFRSAVNGEGDYRAQLRQAKEFEPDDFFWIGFDKDALPIMEQAKEINFIPKQFMAQTTSFPRDINSSPLINGLVYFSWWSNRLADTNKECYNFLKEYEKEYGSDIPTVFWPVQYYTNVMIVCEGIKEAGSLEKEKVIKSLEKIKYKSPLGKTITFGKSKFINHQSSNSMFILQWQNGKEEIIYPWINATTKLIYPFPKWSK